MKVEEKNKWLIIILIVLTLLVLILGGYIIYDNSSTKKESQKNETEIIEENFVYRQCYQSIYYNPVTDTKCDKNDEGCMKWYVISRDSSDNTELEVILNKNLGDTVAFNENDNPEEGPITALNYLKELTSDWQVPVRMPSIDDIASVLGVEKNDKGEIGVLEVPKCLYSNGDNEEFWDGGYWLSDYIEGSSIFIIDCSRGLISAGNQFIKSDATNSTTWGVRPIIKIEKSKISK